MSDVLQLADVAPRVVSTGWQVTEREMMPGKPSLHYHRLLSQRRGLRVVLTLDDDDDGAGCWLHSSTSVSTGRRLRIPTWAELKLVHQFVHGDRAVVQVLPPSAHWLSIAECLHLFERLDAPTIPEQIWRRP